MQELFVDNLLTGLRANAGYAAKLAAGTDATDAVTQSVPDENHPAWILRHLGAYHPVIAGLLEGATPDDPKTHRFGMESKPEPDAALYGPWDTVVADYRAGTDRVAAALEAVRDGDGSALVRPMPVPRWQAKFPRVGDILGYLIIHHEAYHLGQFSAWRRVRGLAPA